MQSDLGDEERFLIDGFVPAYRKLSQDDLASRVKAGLAELADCHACPRNCGVNRIANETRVCNTGRHAIVSSAFPHRGEEDCLRGWNGSGTIFFSLCNLRCVFCHGSVPSRVRGRGYLEGRHTEVRLDRPLPRQWRDRARVRPGPSSGSLALR